MSIQHFSKSDRGFTFLLLAVAAGFSLWSIIGSAPDLPVTFDMFASTPAQCRDAADVIASLDRSRNGVSLTCNSDMLTGSVLR